MIAYLLKNKCAVPDADENTEKFDARRKRTQREIKSLVDQLSLRLPKSRDLTGQNWAETLKTAVTTAPADNEEWKSWQAQLLRKPSTLPFPVIFETNEDLKWQRNKKGRICVHFGDLREHTFEIYCDQR